jgi:hypothetical protein
MATDETKSRPTASQMAALVEARRLERHEMSLTTGRRVRLAVVESCVAVGWLEDIGPVAMCDGDGFTLMPERYRTGYLLTSEGRALVEVDR